MTVIIVIVMFIIAQFVSTASHDIKLSDQGRGKGVGWGVGKEDEVKGHASRHNVACGRGAPCAHDLSTCVYIINIDACSCAQYLTVAEISLERGVDA